MGVAVTAGRLRRDMPTRLRRLGRRGRNVAGRAAAGPSSSVTAASGTRPLGSSIGGSPAGSACWVGEGGGEPLDDKDAEDEDEAVADARPSLSAAAFPMG